MRQVSNNLLLLAHRLFEADKRMRMRGLDVVRDLGGMGVREELTMGAGEDAGREVLDEYVVDLD